jgi:hypothetical protein
MEKFNDAYLYNDWLFLDYNNTTYNLIENALD